MNFTGFRRRWIITPSPNSVSAALEDDIHCMAVTLEHDGAIISAVHAAMDRWPWTTCPGAVDVIRETFTGVGLAEAAKRGAKQANCTHLYDLALLAAAHAVDEGPTHYDAYVADPAGGKVVAEIFGRGQSLLKWSLVDDVITAPAEIAGTSLFALKSWIATLLPEMQEAARLLQWATLIAHGRSIPMERQSDATRMPPNCFTFQPERAKIAARIGRVYDFSGDASEPLSHFENGHFGQAPERRKMVWPL